MTWRDGGSVNADVLTCSQSLGGGGKRGGDEGWVRMGRGTVEEAL